MWALTLAVIAVLIALEPRFRTAERETVQVDECGVVRVDGSVKEQITWQDVEEIKIITTDEGPYQEDVFFALVGPNDKGCLIPHSAAVRTKLLEILQARFSGLDDNMVIKAMGSTTNNSFVVWKRSAGQAA